MADTFKRKFTIGAGATMPKEALDTILTDIESRNANGRHLIGHEFLPNGDEIELTYEATDDETE